MVGSSTFRFSTFTSGHLSTAREEGFFVRRSRKEEPSVGKQVTWGTSTNWSASFLVVAHEQRDETRTRLFGVKAATGTSSNSSDERADIADSALDDDYWFQGLAQPYDLNPVTNTSGDWGAYFKKSPALSSRQRICNEDRRHLFGRQLFADVAVF